MYARFFRYATDRVDKKGIIAFISNNSFVNARTFDGFRKCIQDEFDYAYIIDLGGNIRELSGKDGIFLGEAHTVFGLGAMIGVAITFLVKIENKDKKKCQINYIHPCDIRATRLEKFDWLLANKIGQIFFKKISPESNNWVNIAKKSDWDNLLPVCSKEAKLNKIENDALFNLFSLGVVTSRDSWVYDFNEENLNKKVFFLIDTFNSEAKRLKGIKKENIPVRLAYHIKWSRATKNDLAKNKLYTFDNKKIIKSLYRQVKFTKTAFQGRKKSKKS